MRRINKHLAGRYECCNPGSQHEAQRRQYPINLSVRCTVRKVCKVYRYPFDGGDKRQSAYNYLVVLRTYARIFTAVDTSNKRGRPGDATIPPPSCPHVRTYSRLGFGRTFFLPRTRSIRRKTLAFSCRQQLTAAWTNLFAVPPDDLKICCVCTRSTMLYEGSYTSICRAHQPWD